MPKTKNPAAVALGRLGGKKANGTGARGYWAKLSPAERSIELKKRALKREKSS